jgi:hypothetical protein
MIMKSPHTFRTRWGAVKQPPGLWALEPESLAESIEPWRLHRRTRSASPGRPRVNRCGWAASRFRGNRG